MKHTIAVLTALLLALPAGLYAAEPAAETDPRPPRRRQRLAARQGQYHRSHTPAGVLLIGDSILNG